MITHDTAGVEVTKVTLGSVCKKAAVDAILCMASGFTLPMWPVVFSDEGPTERWQRKIHRRTRSIVG